MKRQVRVILFFFLLFPILSFPQSIEQIQMARLLNQKAELAYRQKDFKLALQLLFQAEKIVPKAQLYFNIGRCYEQLKNPKMAYKYYYLYLLRYPADQKQIQKKLAQLYQQIPVKSRFVVIQTTPILTKIRIGDKEFTAPVLEWLQIGTYPISITLKGYTRISRTIRIHPARTAQVFHFVLSPEEKAPFTLQKRKTPPAPFSPPKKFTRFLPAFLTGAGLLLTLAGIGFYSLGLNKGEYANSLDPARYKTQADFENAVNQNYNSGKNWAIAGYVLCSVGITSLVSGLILYAVQKGYFKKGRNR